MSKIILPHIASGYNLSAINSNFQKVEDELNNKVLYRNSPAGEPNSMSSDLDMNSQSILNASKISSNIIELGGVQVVPTSIAVDPYNGTREALRRSYAEAGYNLVAGSFEAGGTVTMATDALLHEESGIAYSWGGALPKVVPAATNPLLDANWKSQTDAKLRSDLASSSAGKGASLVNTTTGQTVEQRLAALSGTDGFNAVGRLLNLTALRSLVPTVAGAIVFVASAASITHAETHYGGGFFKSVDNVQAWPDDGGVVVKPATGTLVWRRINFTSYDMQFWGVKADGSTDNAVAIAKATTYAKNNRIILDAPAGSILTSQMVPLYSNMGIRGCGKAESTVFYKTTNNVFDFKKNGVTQLSVDALVGFVPNQWDLDDYSMESFAVHVTLIGCMFRRYGLSQSNVGSISPTYGMFMGKAASPVIRQVNIEGGRTGIKAFTVFSGVMEMVAAVQYNNYGYAGVEISDFRGGTLHNSGTSMDMRLVQVRGYQFGFSIHRLQYSTMIDCTAEEIGPMTGETISYAFDFYDPFCISMINCATEFVKGGQIRVQGFANPSFRPALKITGYLAIDQQNPVVPTPMFAVDNGGTTPMNIVIDASELSRQTGLSNLNVPTVSGSGAKVILIGCAGEDWTAASSGVFTRLA